MRLSEPQHSFEQTLDECVTGITGNAVLRQLLTSEKTDLTAVGVQYLGAADTGKLYTILPINTDGNIDPVVINTLTKNELSKFTNNIFLQRKSQPEKFMMLC